MGSWRSQIAPERNLEPDAPIMSPRSLFWICFVAAFILGELETILAQGNLDPEAGGTWLGGPGEPAGGAWGNPGSPTPPVPAH